MDIVIHPHTKSQLESLTANKPHALLLAGPEGCGLKTLAIFTAQQWGTMLEIVEPVSKTKVSLPAINVEAVRSLYERTRMKVVSSHVAIIDNADAMTPAAQNALLKLLEEPAENIHFIVTSHKPDALLPTIRSRLQTLQVHPIDDAASVRLLRKLGVSDERLKAQIVFMAKGLPAEMSRLANDTAYLETTSEMVRCARDFVTGTVYEKLLVIQKVASSRQNALLFLESTMLLLKKTIETSTSADSLELLDKLIEANEQIAANGNVRLQLAAAVI